MTHMTFVLLVAILARTTLLITKDVIAEKPRTWFVRMWPRSWWGFMNYLIECPWCASLSIVGLIAAYPMYASGLSWFEVIGTIAAASLTAGTIANLKSTT